MSYFQEGNQIKWKYEEAVVVLVLSLSVQMKERTHLRKECVRPLAERDREYGENNNNSQKTVGFHWRRRNNNQRAQRVA